jgi:tetratricopeptide (TPR) repeat protein
MEKRREAREHLSSAEESLVRRDYQGFLKKSRKALSLTDLQPPADEALFNAALAYAHLGHAGKDYRKSIDAFKRVLHEFPQSPFAGRAAIWIDVLQENERSRGEIEELNRAAREAKQENERLIREIGELNRTIDKSNQIDIEIDAKKKELSK